MKKKMSLPQVTGYKKIIRCSSLPLMFSCQNAILNPDRLVAVRVEQDMATLGTEIHAAIQRAIEDGKVDMHAIEARYSDADAERAREMFANGLLVVQDAKRQMKGPKFEVEVRFETEKYEVVGHVDILDLQATRAYVVDFKSGRTRDDHYHQMVGYAVGAWTAAGRPKEFTVNIAYVYLEANEVTKFSVDASAMVRWIRDLDALGAGYTVNRRCVHCSLNDTCPTYRTYLQGAAELIVGVGNASAVRLRKLAPADRARFVTAFKAVGYAMERIRVSIKDDVLKNGDIDLGNGSSYTIRRRENKTLLIKRALPVLARYLSNKELRSILSTSFNAAVKAVIERVRGPMQKAVRDDFLKDLDKAGAVLYTDSAYLEIVANKRKLSNVKRRKTVHS